MVTKKSYTKLFTFQKYLGMVMSVFGVLVLLFDHKPGASVPLMIGLFMLFTARSVSITTHRNQPFYYLGISHSPHKLLFQNVPLQVKSVHD